MLRFAVYDRINGTEEIEDSNDIICYLLDTDEKVQDFFVKDELCRRIMSEVEKTKIESYDRFTSPYIGGVFGPERLSGGVSTLLTVYFLCMEGRNDFTFNSAYIGDNCIPYLLEIACKYNINMNMTTPIKITDELFRKYLNIVYNVEEKRFINSSLDFEDTFQRLEANALDEIDKIDASLDTYDKKEWERIEIEVTLQQMEEAERNWKIEQNKKRLGDVNI